MIVSHRSGANIEETSRSVSGAGYLGKTCSPRGFLHGDTTKGIILVFGITAVIALYLGKTVAVVDIACAARNIGSEAPAQESGVEPTKPEAAEVAEIKLITYNLKKAGQAPVSITPESKDLKLEPGDQLIRIYKSKLIEVDVLDNGYKWNGEVYPTLTHISWKVTGYQIGGNNFFGLPTKRRGE